MDAPLAPLPEAFWSTDDATVGRGCQSRRKRRRHRPDRRGWLAWKPISITLTKVAGHCYAHLAIMAPEHWN